MNIDTKKIKLFSTIGQRATVGMCCLEIVKKYPDLMVLTADVSTSAGLEDLEKPTKTLFRCRYSRAKFNFGCSRNSK